MDLEVLVSDMMRINTLARLWHWATDSAAHHATYEQFLTQNEKLTDSFVESALGNDIKLDFSKLGVEKATSKNYSLENARLEIIKYRSQVTESKKVLAATENPGNEELTTILDDLTELNSKTLYLLKLQ